MKNAVIYIHGKGGTPLEAEHYKPLFPDSDVLGFDYLAKTPSEAKTEFTEYFNQIEKRYASVSIIANSIGAYFVMNAQVGKKIVKAYFISPVVDMEGLILDMMKRADTTKAELMEKKELQTPFAETLSWEYLSYTRKNPVVRNIPTYILYGSMDHLTSLQTILDFAKKTGAVLQIYKDGEHWFHTKEQLNAVDQWILKTQK